MEAADNCAKQVKAEIKSEGNMALAMKGSQRIDALRLLDAFPTKKAQWVGLYPIAQFRFIGYSVNELVIKEFHIMKTLFMVLVLLGVVIATTSCNMLRGAGQDIENVGDSIEHVAR